MKYLILVIAVIAISMTITKAGYAVDIKDLVTGFSCMKSAGVDTVIVRAYMRYLFISQIIKKKMFNI